MGLFGKMIADLTPEQKVELDQYDDSDIQEFGAKVKVFLGNPTTG